LKEDVGDGRCFDSRQSAPTQRRGFRWVCHQNVDRNGAVVAEREADVAIVIGQCRRDRGGRCHQDRNGAGSPYMKGSCVMMPSEQNRLE
jgi:hypothetical protein